MRIALVNPVEAQAHGYQNGGSYIPQLGLQVLSRQTPAHHRVDIIDEIFGHDGTENLLHAENYDLVGITAYTCQATRAYQVAQTCRERNIPVIMGGPHAWAKPDEAAEHVDSVAVGECDTLWAEILADAEQGRLQPRYEGKLADLSENLGAGDQTLQPINGNYEIGCIQTSRGCPVGCEYCSVTAFNGPKIRRRPIPEIIKEWNTTPEKFLFVVDDNFFGVSAQHAEWSKELLRAIIKHGKKRIWFSQTTINMGDDLEAVRLAHKAGCRGMLVGFESFNVDNLKECKKGINRKNVNRYEDLVRGFHRGGLAVFGAFIIGAEKDTQDTVADTVHEAVRIGIDIIQITNLTPLPGTKMFDRYIEEGRIFATNFPKDWKRFTFIETVYHPKSMSAQQLDESIHELRVAAANHNWVWKRTLRSLLKTRSLSTAVFVHSMNRQFAKLAGAVSAQNAHRFTTPAEPNHRTQKIQRAMTLLRPTTR